MCPFFDFDRSYVFFTRLMQGVVWGGFAYSKIPFPTRRGRSPRRVGKERFTEAMQPSKPLAFTPLRKVSSLVALAL